MWPDGLATIPYLEHPKQHSYERFKYLYAFGIQWGCRGGAWKFVTEEEEACDVMSNSRWILRKRAGTGCKGQGLKVPPIRAALSLLDGMSREKVLPCSGAYRNYLFRQAMCVPGIIPFPGNNSSVQVLYINTYLATCLGVLVEEEIPRQP